MNTVAGRGGSTLTTYVAATDAELSQPSGIWGDSNGVIYISELAYHCVRKITTDGTLINIAGTVGTSGSSEDGIPATSAPLNYPTNVAVDSSGVVYIAAFSNLKIRTVSTTGIISTIAGNGVDGVTEGVKATSSSVGKPSGMWIDSLGRFYFSTYANSKWYMKILGSDNIISAYAG